jgi:hypothetical protein
MSLWDLMTFLLGATTLGAGLSALSFNEGGFARHTVGCLLSLAAAAAAVGSARVLGNRAFGPRREVSRAWPPYALLAFSMLLVPAISFFIIDLVISKLPAK